VDATYVGPRDEILTSACALWGVENKLTLIRGNENWVYCLGETEYIFRFTNKYHRDFPELAAEIHWIQFLEESGCRVAAAIPSSSQLLIHQLPEDWSVSVFQRAPGKRLSTDSDFNEQIFFNWGKLIGKMHKLTPSYQPITSTRHHWDQDEGFKISQNALLEADPQHPMVIAFSDLIRQLQELPRTPDGYGLIHADLHHGNFFVDDQNELTAFDFDDSHYGWFVNDIAVIFASLDLSQRMGGLTSNMEHFLPIFMQGYKTENQLSPDWLKHLNTFIHFRFALLYFWTTARMQLNRVSSIETCERMKTIFMEKILENRTKPFKL
jgi:amicoumacin kinase